MDGPSRFFISAQALYSRLSTASAPMLVDVRADDEHACHMGYGAKAAVCVDACMAVINGRNVGQHYADATSEAKP